MKLKDLLRALRPLLSEARGVSTAAFVAICGCGSAGAVIVAGSSGAGNNNNTQAGLNAYLSGASLTAFPYWENLIRFSNSSGVYLGFNATTMRGWVLSADHIGPDPASITVAGNSYSVTSSVLSIGNSDLSLYQIGGGVSDPALPSLPTVPLITTIAQLGENALMFGRGFTNNTSTPYTWQTPGLSDSNSMRWGSNTIELNANVNLGTLIARNIQPYTVVDFDGPLGAGATPFDAQGSNGDSGGGLFVLRGGVWQLSGIAHFVDDGPDFLESPETGNEISNSAEIGDFTAYSDVSSKRTSIFSSTGTLIPEPSSLLLTSPALLLLLRRRRCETRH